MNYLNHYNRLVNRASDRVLTGYKERHHIKPRCMGGDDSSENLVDLTPEEHFIAHQFLTKIYLNEPKLVWAVFHMSTKGARNKTYGWLRKKFSENVSKFQSGKPGRRLGMKNSPEHNAKIAAAKLGKKMLPLSEEHKAKLRAAIQGKPHPNKASLFVPRPNQRKPQTPEWRANIGIGVKAARQAQETRAT